MDPRLVSQVVAILAVLSSVLVLFFVGKLVIWSIDYIRSFVLVAVFLCGLLYIYDLNEHHQVVTSKTFAPLVIAYKEAWHLPTHQPPPHPHSDPFTSPLTPPPPATRWFWQ